MSRDRGKGSKYQSIACAELRDGVRWGETLRCVASMCLTSFAPCRIKFCSTILFHKSVLAKRWAKSKRSDSIFITSIVKLLLIRLTVLCWPLMLPVAVIVLYLNEFPAGPLCIVGGALGCPHKKQRERARPLVRLNSVRGTCALAL